MRKPLTSLSSLVFMAACSTGAFLEIPPVPGPPVNWNQFSTSALPDSDCPKLSGAYIEPPEIYPAVEKVKAKLEHNTESYYGHFPFHLADRKELTESEFNLTSNQFIIRQPDADNFYFLFKTKNASIIEYHFRTKEGDFECKGRFIEFPTLVSDGMIEGMSVNSQIRIVILRENTGALVIQKTIGPYRGDPSTAGVQFTHEYLRYPLDERVP